MALQFLSALARRQLPATFSDRVEVAAVKGLFAAQCVDATFAKEPNGGELAVVHGITAHGRTAMQALGDDRRVSGPALKPPNKS